MFCIISFYFYQSKLGFCICFFNCQSCKCGQLSHNYIKGDLGNLNFSSTTILTLLFSWATSGVYIFKLMLRIPSRTYEVIYSYIFIFIFCLLLYIIQHLTQISIQSPLQKSVFGMFERARTLSTGIIAR